MKKKVTYKLEQTKSIIVEVETAEQEQKIKELNRDFERIDRQNRRIAAKTDSLERMYEETGYEVIDDGANPEEQYEQKELKNTIAKAIFVYRIFVQSISALYVVGAISDRRRMEYRDGHILCDCAEERR